jgi:hypothetical protein
MRGCKVFKAASASPSGDVRAPNSQGTSIERLIEGCKSGRSCRRKEICRVLGGGLGERLVDPESAGWRRRYRNIGSRCDISLRNQREWGWTRHLCACPTALGGNDYVTSLAWDRWDDASHRHSASDAFSASDGALKKCVWTSNRWTTRFLAKRTGTTLTKVATTQAKAAVSTRALSLWTSLNDASESGLNENKPWRPMKGKARHLVLSVVCLAAWLQTVTQEQTAGPLFERAEAMIPMRDRIRLPTAIFVPKYTSEPLPFLFTRTPYGVPENEKKITDPGTTLSVLSQDGYIFVFQDIRGRFGVGGTVRDAASTTRQASPEVDRRGQRCL